MSKKEIGFHYGALSDPLEKQANEQGYTFGDKADLVQNACHDMIMLHIHSVITDGEYKKILPRFHKWAANFLKPLEVTDDDE